VRFLIAISMYTCAALAQPALPTTAPRTVNLPVVGLASSETAQVNVANLGTLALAIAPGSALPTAPCTGTIQFYNASGSAIGSSTPFSISVGQISSATVPYSAVVPGDPPPTGNGRTTIRATATTNAPCSVAANIETFDSMTGVTHVHVEGSSTLLGLASLLNVR
jgi:hypothetical protein